MLFGDRFDPGDQCRRVLAVVVDSSGFAPAAEGAVLYLHDDDLREMKGAAADPER